MPTTRPMTSTQATASARSAALAWQQGSATGLADSCATLTVDELQRWPDLARWRGLLGLLREDEESLACLALAHEGHAAEGRAVDAGIDACIALAMCLCDVGAMEDVNSWLARAEPVLAGAAHDDSAAAALWWHLGQVACAVMRPAPAPGTADAGARERASLAWLHRLWRPLAPPRPPHEQLFVATLLVNAQFGRQQYEQFDLLAGTVGSAAVLGAVADLPAARWQYTLGFAYYQVGRLDAAQTAWEAGLLRAQAQPQMALLLGLASLRVLLDQGRLVEAQKLLAGQATAWGSGRASQRVELAQMRARLALLQGRPAAAEAAITEALALAEQVGFSNAERASCHTDQAQVWLALGREGPALALLQQQAQALAGRDAAIFQCLAQLVQALQAPSTEARLQTLTPGLALAARLRYPMFFRLLPDWAARVCGMALEGGVEVAFATDVVRQRALPAPPGAGRHWPWPLWLRMLGGFELRLHGQVQPRQAKPQAKPLELLRLLACTPGMGLGMAQAADALWPDADGAAAQKALEVTLHRLRKLLGDAQLLTQSEGHLQLDTQRASSDLRLRDALTHQLVDEALAPRGGARDAEAISARLRDWLALAAPTAILLPGAPEAPWLLERRQQVQRDQRRAQGAVATLMARARAAGPRDTQTDDTLAALQATVDQAFDARAG